MDVGKMLSMYREFRAGAPLGDVAVLKMDALSKPPPGLEKRLVGIRGYAPDQDLEELRSLPRGTLGGCYAAFLDAQGIEPLRISDTIKERFRKNPYPIRFITTHDLHHLLTGFDAGIAGEAGVAAFNVGQRSANFGWTMLRVMRWLYALVSPANARAIWHNIRLGRELGRDAGLVMAYPLEENFGRPLAEVREQLHIPDPRISGVRSSRPSRLVDWIYRNRPVTRAEPGGG
jgi:ubiquinone biosynthesis protein Coq4